MADTLDMGRNGFAVFTPSGKAAGGPSGPYYALVPDGGSAQFAAAAVPGFGNDLPDATRAEGVPVVGRFTEAGLDVTTGTVLAYPENPS